MTLAGIGFVGYGVLFIFKRRGGERERPDEVDERKGTQEVGHRTSTSDPVQYHACIQTAWQAAAPLWPAWFEVLEVEEEGAWSKPDAGRPGPHRP
jgi:hypothetical protein